MQEAVLQQLAQDTGRFLLARKLFLVTAESCTGGWIAKVMTDVAGSSQWFERGFVTYTNEAKEELLGVHGELFEAHGAVSLPVVMEMALGALKQSHAQVAVSVSGIAGPGGGSEEKPVGTICFGWAWGSIRWADRQHFPGDREAVRRQAVIRALEGMRELVGQ
ncbi:MAG: nicotinamide-nucleotide amidase [Gammaproteobacteria bacterium]|nr:MAG: nicotinamide-nucleotide amidase [Gammaproteobacteria bacterium]